MALRNFYTDSFSSKHFTCSKLTISTRKRFEICSKLTCSNVHWRRSSVFIANFELISYFFSSVSIVDFEKVNVC